MLRTLLLEIAVVVSVACVIGAVTIVGRARLRTCYTELGTRLREAGPYLVALGVLLAINSALRDSTEEFSLFVGWNITGWIETIEGDFVVFVQSFQTELLTTYFSYIYVHGYVFLLGFPLVAYVALENQRRFRELVVAYGLNYMLGTVLYVAFIAFGPRNVGLVDGLLYTTFPQFQFLTSEINNPTNVFPSLHTSLSVTAAIFAYKTREVYPAWLPLAVVLAVSVVISTMYLGIHWAIDVVAGIALAAVCVSVAERGVDAQNRWVAAAPEGTSAVLEFPYVGTRVETLSAAIGATRWTTRFERDADAETETETEPGEVGSD